MNLDKDTFQGLIKYITKVVVLIVPGLAINEFVFHKGFYSGGVDNIYDLLLLLIWSIIYSLPYYFCLLVNIALHEIQTKEHLEKAADDPEIFEAIIPVLLVLIIINWIAYKTIFSLNWLTSLPRFAISQQIALFVSSVMITCVLSFPISKIYYYFLHKLGAKVRKSLAKRFSSAITKQK